MAKPKTACPQPLVNPKTGCPHPHSLDDEPDVSGRKRKKDTRTTMTFTHHLTGH